MEKSCYCCDKIHVDPGTKENFTNLDLALKELDMIKINPETQKYRQFQKLSENWNNSAAPSNLGKRTVKSIQSGFCVLHMNKRFVTNFVTSATTFSKAKAKKEDPCRERYASSSNAFVPRVKDAQPCYNGTVSSHQTVTCSLKIRPSRTRFRFQKPYDIPWLRKLEERVRACRWNQEKEGSSEDPGGCNRSNPSSPSKSGHPSSNGGLMRSRSLDNLASKSWKENEKSGRKSVVPENKDIECVSQQMKDLQVI